MIIGNYAGGIEYFEGEMEAIYHEVGRVFFEDITPKYEYVISDNLGNTRVVFMNNNGMAEVIQENEYYSFGLAFEKENTAYNYTYNHKVFGWQLLLFC